MNDKLEEIINILSNLNTIDYNYDKKDVFNIVKSYVLEVYDMGSQSVFDNFDVYDREELNSSGNSDSNYAHPHSILSST